MSLEYRVCWMREGDARIRYRVYQSPHGTEMFIRFLLGELSTKPWNGPPLTVPPYVEVRDVSEWRSRDQERIEVGV